MVFVFFFLEDPSLGYFVRRNSSLVLAYPMCHPVSQREKNATGSMFLSNCSDGTWVSGCLRHEPGHRYFSLARRAPLGSCSYLFHSTTSKFLKAAKFERISFIFSLFKIIKGSTRGLTKIIYKILCGTLRPY